MGSSVDTPLGGSVALPSRLFGDFDEHPQRTEAVPEFLMSATEITNKQYEQFDPAHRALRGLHGWSTKDDEAVVFVSHANATRYCEWLSAVTSQHETYRLASELEWERATRAGSKSNFWYGDNFNVSEAKGNAGNSPAGIVQDLTVGVFSGNPFGLYDCHGNVEEWTATPYGQPTGLWVTRGGSHSTDPFYLRSANRAAALAEERSEVIGFRVAAGSPVSTTTEHVNVWQPHTKTTQAPPVLDAALTVPSAAGETFFAGPFEYVRFSSSISNETGGPLFLHHNHAPGLGLQPDGSLIVTWFSCVSETGREPSYAVSSLTPVHLLTGGWTEAGVFFKVADRGEQTSLFHKSSWFASLGSSGGYRNSTMIRRDRGTTGAWGSAAVVTHVHQGNISLPGHGDGHIPFERIVELSDGTLGMSSTVLGCPHATGRVSGACSQTLLSSDKGDSWRPSGGYHSGISQFVELRDNTTWLALGRAGSNVPTAAIPSLTRSVSTDSGRSWRYGWQRELRPLGSGHRHVFFRLREGPLLLISFTGGSNCTTISGKTRRFSGLYATLSEDEGATFADMKPLVDEASVRKQFPTMDGKLWTMSNSTAEPEGYTSARQDARGVIHVVSSRLSYHFNLRWLRSPPPDAPDAPPPPCPLKPKGDGIPAGTWYTARADWQMHSPTAKR